MPSKNPRVNVTLEPDLVVLLDSLAEQENKSTSGLVKELILEALERREDMALSALGKKLDTPDRKTIKHDEG